MTLPRVARILLPLLLGTALVLALTLLPGRRAAERPEPLRRETVTAAGSRVVFELAAAPPLTMTATPLRLRLTDARGAPLTGAAVDCDLTMPAMPMPQNRPPLHEEAAGVYAGEALFTMAGAWRASFVIRRPDGRSEQAVFDIGEVKLR
jgi:hypothetical protein